MQSDEPTACFMSSQEIAQLYGLRENSMCKALERWRSPQNREDWHEDADPISRHSRYFYRLSAVRQVAERMSCHPNPPEENSSLETSG